jgi:hypothetical protein
LAWRRARRSGSANWFGWAKRPRSVSGTRRRGRLGGRPTAPDRVGRGQFGFQRGLPAAEHRRVEVGGLGLLVGVELGVLEGSLDEVQVGGRLLRRVGKFVAALDEVIQFLLADGEFGLELLGLLGAGERFERRELLAVPRSN